MATTQHPYGELIVYKYYTCVISLTTQRNYRLMQEIFFSYII